MFDMLVTAVTSQSLISLIERFGPDEHAAHIGDFRSVPTSYVHVECLSAVEHTRHSSNFSGIPVANVLIEQLRGLKHAWTCP